jgi:membrane associated rhomboid family serine protease
MRSFIDDLRYEWNRPNNVITRLILINVIVFIFTGIIDLFGRLSITMMHVQNFVNKLFMLPPDLLDFALSPWTILSYGFMHGGFLHILMNMLMLYWFGRFVGDYIGAQRLIGLYVWGVIGGGLLFLLSFNTLFTGIKTQGLVGASAGVYAILVGGATLMPNMRVHLLLLGAVKLKYLAAASIFLSIIAIGLGNTGGNMAHLGGALVGYLFIKQYQRGKDWSIIITKIMDFFTNLWKRRKKVRMKATTYGNKAANQKNAPSAVVPNQEIIDRILDKISESGYESLTSEEKQVLFRASQKQ